LPSPESWLLVFLHSSHVVKKF